MSCKTTATNIFVLMTNQFYINQYKKLTLIIFTICAVGLIIFTCAQTFFANSYLFNFRTELKTLPKLEEIKHEDYSIRPKIRHRFHRYPHTSRYLPQCIIIGVRKGGTGALIHFLDIHPNIAIASTEVHFFDNNYKRGLNWYRKRMPYSFPNQITIEKTPAYFVKKHVPESVKKMNQSIKLLLIVREPVERTISDYTQIWGKLVRNSSYPTFEELAIDPATKMVNPSFAATERSLYDKHMANWLKYFNLSQIHIVDGDNFRRNPFQEIVEIEKFLHLEHKISEKDYYFDPDKKFYCIKGFINRCLPDSKGRQHVKVQDYVKTKLRKFFRPHNEMFFKMISRRFENW
ncbi:heparan sulfate glucosamine 3-O-sulfotransferase 5 [Octopus vulgaris]|uniref:Heparan sulfate glucosamine 3-O-sulfotransferase 5 n=1 Tax=Octopus vulgaris TaxID=6645 RepID=A0AA36B930_OCTVU|nr:heparan sulfate glucosamine 3-O-sulfotransferase 5 [Octopus vulgaris]